MEFNDLLRLVGIDAAETAIMLHAPAEVGLRRGLLALAHEEPALFEVYQDNHPPNAEATLKRRAFAASFIMEDGDSARFAGLYRNTGWKAASATELDADPVRRQLQQRFRGAGFVERLGLEGERAVFAQERMDALTEWRGRLVVRRAPGRAYMRLAENNRLEIIEISRTPQYAPPAPDWRDFIVTGTEMRVLPKAWRARLREWRGVYLIIDPEDGARYVGSAYGAENLLGRWGAHVAGEAGVTVDLKGRDPSRFRFSILELLAPSAESGEVFQVETRWKETLGTQEWGLNRN